MSDLLNPNATVNKKLTSVASLADDTVTAGKRREVVGMDTDGVLVDEDKAENAISDFAGHAH